jgi:hypothetical protein
MYQSLADIIENHNDWQETKAAHQLQLLLKSYIESLGLAKGNKVSRPTRGP